MHPREEPARARVGSLDAKVELPDGRALRIDRDGRWLSARLGGEFYRRTMGGGVVLQRRPGDAPRDHPDPASIHEAVRCLATDQLGDLSHVELAGELASVAALQEMLERASGWTPERRERERQRFLRAYPEPVEILPPDRYRDVVVLPATGCPNAGCSFCAFYRDRTFRARGEAVFREHVRAVARLFGSALGLRDGVFLGSASALSLSDRRLLTALHIAREELGDTRRGVAAFWDPDHSPRRPPAAWTELLRAGLRAVCVGLETGWAELRAEMGKSPDLDRLVTDVRAAHGVGMEVTLVVLAGYGGQRHAERHREETARVIGRLRLGERDSIYVSPLSGADLPHDWLQREAARLRRTLREVGPARAVPYAMDAFRYYA